MAVTTPFEPVAEVFARNLSIRHVYADPVHNGDTVIIPVAKLAYGFGAGSGRGPGPRSTTAGSSRDGDKMEAKGGGGGGGARLTPIGALEVGPGGTRFVRYDKWSRLAGVFALGLGIGALLVARLR